MNGKHTLKEGTAHLWMPSFFCVCYGLLQMILDIRSPTERIVGLKRAKIFQNRKFLPAFKDFYVFAFYCLI